MGSVITSKKGLLKLVNGQIDIEVDGSKQPAKDGEQLPKGAVLNIGENATYEITFDDGTKLSNEVEPNTTAAVAPTANNDAAFDEIQALQDLIASGEDPTKNLPETAAGNTPGRDGNSGYVTLARGGSEIIASSGYSTSGQSFAATVINTPEQTIATDSPSILNNDSNIVDEDTIASGNVLDNDSDVDSILSVVSFEINGTTYAAGTEVALESGSLVLNADGSYTFTPNENWNGQVPVITYTTNTGASTTLTINITPVDDPSIITNDSTTVAEDTVATGNVLDNDSDVDSTLSVVSFEVGGTTYASGTEVALEGGILVLNTDGSYTFTPNENWNGQVPVITYTTNTGSSATLTINVTPVADGGPSVTINTDTNNDGFISNEELAGNTEVNVTIGLDGTGANVGDTLTVNGVDYTLTQEDINNGFVNLNLLAPGEGETITVVATITDSAGNTSPEGSDSALLDTTAPTITVDAPDETQDTTPTITGSTDAPPGSTITIVVTDSTGAEQTLTTTVNPDGTYSVDVISPLAEGPITATATVTDPAGNTGTATDDGNVDITAPNITVDAPDNTQDTTPTITGSSNATPGSAITIVVTDNTGAEQTLTTTVNEDGTYAVDVTTPLAEGDYTAVATVKDPAGNTGKATDNGNVDTQIDQDGDGNTVAITSITDDTGASAATSSPMTTP
uniref:retention module-containing protein n=1 Tax=Shewanella morhuae TaxID=365591 RepID=UPI00215990E5|nr:retention module-containing protein [Shewanella morhuae]